MKTFSSYKSDVTRAQQLAAHLIARAMSGQRPMTYDEAAAYIDKGRPDFVAKVLYNIYNWCKSHDLPQLTSLVVGKHTGKPGEGFTDMTADWASEQRKVYSYDWRDVIPPTAKDLEAVN